MSAKSSRHSIELVYLYCYGFSGRPWSATNVLLI